MKKRCVAHHGWWLTDNWLDLTWLALVCFLLCCASNWKPCSTRNDWLQRWRTSFLSGALALLVLVVLPGEWMNPLIRIMITICYYHSGSSCSFIVSLIEQVLVIMRASSQVNFKLIPPWYVYTIILLHHHNIIMNCSFDKKNLRNMWWWQHYHTSHGSFF